MKYRVTGSYTITFRQTILWIAGDVTRTVDVDELVDANEPLVAIDLVTELLVEAILEPDDEFLYDNSDRLIARVLTERDEAELAEKAELDERRRAVEMMRRFSTPLIV